MKRSNVSTRLIAPSSQSKMHPRWRRYISGQRLSLLIVLLTLLFFSVSSYVGSAKNNELLKTARNERSVLIVSTSQLSDMTKQELSYIQSLLDVVDKQNDELKKAGRQIIVIPAPPAKPFILPTTSPTSKITPTPKTTK